ncbi:ABC transporter ATP-binding protein [Rhodococcus coprophilus]|uniref:ABC transporter ATP-binding protein n=1 Tax=Rhodococcus coprophilus TaxID=38310 RepID=A0A2X4UCC6_9NOCA|nr:ABC transporter ATP-binding protein [Rhodococcus coprophilus]MBM7459569.1 iron complex transport system ATP-binding protein [Rhodococcus coprophilus]SQI36521.1 ABC transporter ATP-binding protein [Rhodococcus coprophilus]
MTLAATSLRWSRGGNLVVDDVTIDPQPGETIGLLGPNGSGKSSLLRLLAGVDGPDSGAVTLDGTDIRTLGRRALSKRVAMVSQHSHTEVDIRVRDVVRLGRVPHSDVFGRDEGGDAAIGRALAVTGMTGHADRMWRAMSGGERQRAQIARALAQDPQELLLDEPTNHLDIQHQLDILERVVALPVTSYVALHDLNLAAMFCDRVVVLSRGRIVAHGSPVDALTSDMIERVYGVRASVAEDGRTPVIRYHRVREQESAGQG